MSNQVLALTQITGQNALQFMQGYVTCDLDDLNKNQALPMALTSVKGRVLANGWVYGSTDEVFLVTDASLQNIISLHLKPYLMFGRCKLEFGEEPTFAVREPQSKGAIHLNPLDIYISNEAASDFELAAYLLHEKYVLVTDATSDKFLPQMLGLTSHNVVSFTKGCYLGQEVVARAEHRGRVKRGIVQVNNSSETVEVGTELDLPNHTKGTVVARHEDNLLVVCDLTKVGDLGGSVLQSV